MGHAQRARMAGTRQALYGASATPFEGCYRWELASQRHDGIWTALVEVTVAVALALAGLGALLWIVLVPLLIVSGHSVVHTLLQTLARTTRRSRVADMAP